MPKKCYRCGEPIEEKTPFCPACRAPQIRVQAQPAESAGNSSLAEPLLPDASPEASLPEAAPADAPPPPPPALEPAGKIQWSIFFQTASPLAALTGFLAFLFFPLAVLVVFPFSLRRTLHRYRAHHAGPLASGQGAWLGAFMALLSFIAFLIFFLATISLKREALLKAFQEQATRYPDPQSQQVLSWFSTNEGFVVLTVFALLLALAIFVAVGAISGALMAAPPKKRL